jgi:hypothetical protein
MKVAYRQQFTDLQDDLAEAREFNDQRRIEDLQEELETLTQECAYTLDSGKRQAAAQAEQARLNVTRAIRRTLHKITKNHPSLGDYLTRTIRTGNICVYSPQADQTMLWQFAE